MSEDTIRPATEPRATAVVVEREPRSEGFLSQLGQAARDNPASAALIAMGATWLLAGGGRVSILGGRLGGRRGAAQAVYGYPAGYGYPPPMASPMEAELEGSAGARRGAAELERAGAGAARRTDDAARSARQAAARAGEGAAELASDVGERLGDVAQAGYRGASSAARGAGDALSRASHAAWTETEEFGQSAREYLEERPLAIGALGLAAGVGLALALPRTRTEAEWLGERSDAFKSQARRAASTRLQDARRGADDVAKRLVRDAEAHGFSSDAIAGAVQEFQSKLEKVALAAKDAAEDEVAGGTDAKPGRTLTRHRSPGRLLPGITGPPRLPALEQFMKWGDVTLTGRGRGSG